MRALPLLIGWLTLLASTAGAFQDGPWNVLWLSVEDMSPWIGPYGDRTVPTPHLDALAARGIRFDNAFADSPVCAPARTALITGCYPTRIGAMHMRTRSRSQAAIDGNPEAYRDIPLYEAVPPAWVRCFPEHLRRAGYFATNSSKTDYQFNAPPTVWDRSSGKAHYRDRPEGAPFFAVFNHGGTHESQAFPESRRRPELLAAEDAPVPPIYPDTPAVRDAMARTYNNIAAMDAWVGERLAELEAEGEGGSTVVFFFSDHGVGLPRGKRSVYGTGTRVPLIVSFPEERWPEELREAGLGPGSSTKRIVSFIDFGPTVLSLASIDPDERLDGRAFLGAHAAPPRRHAFLHADRFDAARDRTRAVTDGELLLVHNLLPEVPHLIANAYRERIPMTHDLYALRDGGPRAWQRAPEQWQVASLRRPAVERYDRREDPWEVRPLSLEELDTGRAARFEGLETALADWMEATGDLGLVLPETRLVNDHLWPPSGAQPTTAAPELEQAAGGAVRLTSDTEGASLGYRFEEEGPWQVPTASGGIDIGEHRTLWAIAHRIGFKPSPVVRFQRPE